MKTTSGRGFSLKLNNCLLLWRYGFSRNVCDSQVMLHSAMWTLFNKMQSPNHCLFVRNNIDSVRSRGHNFHLMGFRQNFSGRRRHHVIAPAVLSLSRKHVDGWVLGLPLYQWFAVEMASKYSDWTIKQLKEELSKKCCKNSG